MKNQLHVLLASDTPNRLQSRMHEALKQLPGNQTLASMPPWRVRLAPDEFMNVRVSFLDQMEEAKRTILDSKLQAQYDLIFLGERWGKSTSFGRELALERRSRGLQPPPLVLLCDRMAELPTTLASGADAVLQSTNILQLLNQFLAVHGSINRKKTS